MARSRFAQTRDSRPGGDLRFIRKQSKPPERLPKCESVINKGGRASGDPPGRRERTIT
jgi:hypothetical protein